MTGLISVVIPVYNVEPFLEECLDSVVRQTYKDLEIILVNDGSTDGSETICRQFALKDKRIKVICQENQGLAAARNSGLDAAAGKWIAFVDSDDVISPDMLEKLADSVSTNKTPIAVCGLHSFIDEDGSRKDNGKIVPPEGVWSEEDYWKFYDAGGPMICDVVWNKLYDADFWKDRRFIPGKANEDAFVMHYIIGKGQRISTVPEALYGYRIRGKSIMHSRYSLKRLDAVEAYLDRTAYFWKRGLNEPADRMLRQAVYFLVEGWCLLDLKENNNKKRYDELRDRCRQLCKVRKQRPLSKKMKWSLIPFLAGERYYVMLFRLRELMTGSKKAGLKG